MINFAYVANNVEDALKILRAFRPHSNGAARIGSGAIISLFMFKDYY